MQMLRHWAVRHSRVMEICYDAFEALLVALEPLWRRIGYQRLETPFAVAEKVLKGALFDCQMCGQCALSETGMSCPMNCPKTLRHGPCGGVRADGNCEVIPAMRCVWVEAVEGSRNMREGPAAIRALRPPVDRRLIGRSAWLRVIRMKTKAAAE